MKNLVFNVFILLFFLASHQPVLAQPQACPNNSVTGLKNFCMTDEQALWRGGKPTTAGFEWLVEKGVKSVVNLELLYDDLESLVGVKGTTKPVKEIGYFKVRNWEPIAVLSPKLQDEHIARFLAIMAVSPKPVYVHCRSGQNRTGINVAAYRLFVEGMETEAAIADMKLYNGHWFEADAKYLRGIDSARKQAILAKVEAYKNQVKPHSVVICTEQACVATK